MNPLSSKLRRARQNAGLSQKELGKRLGISEMAISAYETDRAIPPLPTLEKIAKITKKPFTYFIQEKKQISLEKIYQELQKIKIDIAEILKKIGE